MVGWRPPTCGEDYGVAVGGGVLSLHWPGGEQPPDFALSFAALSCDQPGCAFPTTFQPPAHGGLPGSRSVLPSTVRTSTSVEPAAVSPVIFTDLPAYALRGYASPKNHLGPASSVYVLPPLSSV